MGIKQKDGKVVLNPEPNYRFQEGDCGFVICDSEDHKAKLKNVALGATVKDTLLEEPPSRPPTTTPTKNATTQKKKKSESDCEDEDKKEEDKQPQKQKEERNEGKVSFEVEGFETKPEYSYHISNTSTSSLSDITIQSMKEVPHWQSLGHILLCGNPNHCNMLSELIFELRREYWRVVPIVILSPAPPSQEVLEEISSIPEVYYLQVRIVYNFNVKHFFFVCFFTCCAFLDFFLFSLFVFFTFFLYFGLWILVF